MEQQGNNMMQQMFGENYEIANETKPVGINFIFEEIYRRNNSDVGEEGVKDKISSSNYRKKLNEMFDSLFDKKHEEVLLRDEGGYMIYGKGVIFIFFLFDTYNFSSMKSIRKKQYENIDRLYENKLLFYASEFLKERKIHETEKDIPTDELARTLLEKFGLNDDSLELIKALYDFNNMVNDFLYSSDTKIIHKETAEAVSKCSSISDLISFSNKEVSNKEVSNKEVAECIDKFAEVVINECNNAGKNFYYNKVLQELMNQI